MQHIHLENLLATRSIKLKQLHKLQEDIESVEANIASTSCPFHLGQLIHQQSKDGIQISYLICEINFIPIKPHFELWISRKLNTKESYTFSTQLELCQHPEKFIGVKNFIPEFSTEFQTRFQNFKLKNFFHLKKEPPTSNDLWNIP